MEPDQNTPGDSGDESAEVETASEARSFLADVDPLDVDGVRTVAIGAGLWLLAFVMLLPFRGRLVENGQDWWLWTCAAGFGIGMFGWDHCRRRRRKREARAHAPGRRTT